MNAQLSWLDRPYQRHSDTSQDAANSISESRAETDRARVLRYVQMAYSATDEMIATALCMNPSTARPRRIELVRLGLVQDSGRRKKTASGRLATLWEAC